MDIEIFILCVDELRDRILESKVYLFIIHKQTYTFQCTAKLKI